MEERHMVMNGMEGVEGKERKAGEAKGKGLRLCDLLVRILALALALGAALALGVDKQTKVVAIKLVDTLPPFNVPVTAKWHYLSAFRYFVVANAIACVYAAASIVVAVANRGGNGSKRLLGAFIILSDAMIASLLFSANGAALGVGLIGFQGNSHVRWNKVCNVFGKFCNQVAVAVVLSLLASIAFLFVLLLPLFNFHHTL